MPTSTACLVHRRGPLFWFRKAVPVDLTDRLGCSDIRRGAKYLDEIRTKLDIFLRTIGDRPVHSYSVLDMRGYRDLVDRMPKDAIKHLGTDDPRRAIALNARRRLPLPAIGETTVNAKYLSAVRGLFEYLLDEQIIDRSPMDGVRSEQKRDGHAQLLPSEVRLPFIAEHIIALRRIADRKPKWSVDRWWIHIMPRTGLRDEEIAELSVADFREHHGRTCVDLLHLGDGDPINVQRREQLRLKSPAARRIIPIHRSLLEDGIMEFVEKRRREGGPLALLFPQEKPNKYGARSSAMSKRVNGQVDKVTEDPRYVAYSARHTFAAACDAAGVPERIRDRLMGHEPREHEDGNSRRARGSHVRSRYGSPILSAEEMSWIDKLKFPGDE